MPSTSVFRTGIIKYEKYIYRMIEERFDEKSSQLTGFRSDNRTKENNMINILLQVTTGPSRRRYNVFTKQTTIKIVMIISNSINNNYLFCIERFFKVPETMCF